MAVPACYVFPVPIAHTALKSIGPSIFLLRHNQTPNDASRQVGAADVSPSHYLQTIQISRRGIIQILTLALGKLYCLVLVVSFVQQRSIDLILLIGVVASKQSHVGLGLGPTTTTTTTVALGGRLLLLLLLAQIDGPKCKHCPITHCPITIWAGDDGVVREGPSGKSWLNTDVEKIENAVIGVGGRRLGRIEFLGRSHLRIELIFIVNGNATRSSAAVRVTVGVPNHQLALFQH